MTCQSSPVENLRRHPRGCSPPEFFLLEPWLTVENWAAVAVFSPLEVADYLVAGDLLRVHKAFAGSFYVKSAQLGRAFGALWAAFVEDLARLAGFRRAL